MNSGRINRHHNNRRGPDALNRQLFCLRCLKFGHYRQNCWNKPIATCGRCFRTNYLRKECPCNTNAIHGMNLRMVGDQTFPRPCLDVSIGSRLFEAFINQSTSQTTINPDVLSHINSKREQMNLPKVTCPGVVNFQIKRREIEVTLDLEVRKDQTEAVILGNDFLTGSGFHLTVDGITVNERSIVVDNSRTIDFLYNMPQQGGQLKEWLEANHRPLMSKYTKGENPALQQEPIIIVQNEQYIPQPEAGAVIDADVLDIHPEDEDLNNM